MTKGYCSAFGDFHVLLKVYLHHYLQWKPVTTEAGSQDFDVSKEKYEGTITKIAPKKSESQENVVGFHPPATWTPKCFSLEPEQILINNYSAIKTY